MDIWQWTAEFNTRAWEARDEPRTKLLELLNQGVNLQEQNPQAGLYYLGQGRALAESLNEKWWVLLFDHWALQNLIFYSKNYTLALEIAIKATVEVRKPDYESFPQRVCLHEDLITVYQGIDPHGYAEAIKNALDYIATQVTPTVECYYCLQSKKALYSLNQDELNTTRQILYRGLSDIEGNYDFSGAYHKASLYSILCRVAYREKDLPKLSEYAEQTTYHAQRNDHKIGELGGWAFGLLAQHRRGDARGAKRSLRHLKNRVNHYGSSLPDDYYEGVCAYYEEIHEFEKALEMRRQELAGIVGKGLTWEEYQVRLKICRLLARLGFKPRLHAEVTQAQELARKLRQPEKYLAELNQFLG